MDFGAADGAGLGALAGVALPQEAAFDLKATVELDLAAEPLRISTNNLAVTVGQSDVAGSVSIELGDTPKITANLASEYFAFGELSAASGADDENTPEAEPASTDRIFSDDSADIAALSRVCRTQICRTVGELYGCDQRFALG